MIKEICSVDPNPLISQLSMLEWVLGGGGYAMIEEHQFPYDFSPSYLYSKILPLYPNRERGMTLLSMLVPGQLIPSHRDAHDNGCPTRIHIPLTTNEDAHFKSEDHIHHMRVNLAYEINPTLPHSAWNYGTTNRIHLIFNLKES